MSAGLVHDNHLKLAVHKHWKVDLRACDRSSAPRRQVSSVDQEGYHACSWFHHKTGQALVLEYRYCHTIPVFEVPLIQSQMVVAVTGQLRSRKD